MKSWKNTWDLLTIISLSILLILIIYLFPDSMWRKVIGLPFILFFPGYSLITFLFPEKRSLDGIERVALSFGLSIAITPLIGLALNYTPFGIRLTPILLSLASFNILFSLLAMQRRVKTREPFIPEIDVKGAVGWEEMGKLDRILTVILVIAIITSTVILIYIIVTPKQGEKFTEFYILGPEGKAADYPTKLRVGQNAKVIIGIANHEYRMVNYTVEIWLVNASYENNRTVIRHMYFFDRFSVTLNHTDIDIEGNWTPQWEMPYTFSIDRPGRYKLWFLLFKDVVPPLPFEPEKMKEYTGTEAEKRIVDAVEGRIQSLNLNVAVRRI
jgi:uncharacterized membrane protein